jgi:hypothetical protein
MKSSFLVSILLLKEKLHGMVILTTRIPIQYNKASISMDERTSQLKQIVEELAETKFNTFFILNTSRISDGGCESVFINDYGTMLTVVVIGGIIAPIERIFCQYFGTQIKSTSEEREGY